MLAKPRNSVLRVNMTITMAAERVLIVRELAVFKQGGWVENDLLTRVRLLGAKTYDRNLPILGRVGMFRIQTA